METNLSMAQILCARFQTIPTAEEKKFRDDDALSAFLASCRALSCFVTTEDIRSCDSECIYVFSDSSRLAVANPNQRVYPARASVLKDGTEDCPCTAMSDSAKPRTE